MDIQLGAIRTAVGNAAKELALRGEQVLQNASQAEATAALVKSHQPGLVVETVRNNAFSYDSFKLTGEAASLLKTGGDLSKATVDFSAAEPKGTVVRRGFLVAGSGDSGELQYPLQFPQTPFDKLSQELDLADQPEFKALAQKYIAGTGTPGTMPKLGAADLAQIKRTLQPGDLLVNGDDNSFIHATFFVGKDPELQAQLEQKWGLQAGSLDGEALVIHALAGDADATAGNQTYRAAGTGVVVDTLDRYLVRHPRDIAVGLRPKGVTDADRQAMIQTAKGFVGKAYDFALDPHDDREMYCTKLAERILDSVPTTPTIAHQIETIGSLPKTALQGLSPAQQQEVSQIAQQYLKQEVTMVPGFLMNPDLDMVYASPTTLETPQFKGLQAIADGYAKGDPTITQRMPGIAPHAADRLAELARLVQSEQAPAPAAKPAA